MAHELAHALAYLRAVWICVGGLILAAPITVEWPMVPAGSLEGCVARGGTLC